MTLERLARAAGGRLIAPGCARFGDVNGVVAFCLALWRHGLVPETVRSRGRSYLVPFDPLTDPEEIPTSLHQAR